MSMDKTTARPVRNRRHSRRAWPPGEPHHPNDRLQKRLFTPEIKRMLKDWLVRRRENPYPSRDEKKTLAINTGLTYIQICNWFANWRRKLKNAGREPAKKTWGHLIKTYNVSANGNVEQFSICSEDSIWGDDERSPYGNEAHLCGARDPPVFMVDHTGSGNGSSRPPPPHILGYYDRLTEMMPPADHHQHNNSHTTNRQRNPICGYFATKVLGNGTTSDSMENGRSSSDDRKMQTYFMAADSQEQCFQISSTTQTNNSHDKSLRSSGDSHSSTNNSPTAMSVERTSASVHPKPLGPTNAKYKNHIMEKYLRDLEPENPPSQAPAMNNDHLDSRMNDSGSRTLPLTNPPANSMGNPLAAVSDNVMPQLGGLELSKWLESAANFTPKKNNYVEWETRNKTTQDKHTAAQYSNHEREDLEAAEVLTSLAGNYRSRMFGIAPTATACAANQP